MPTVDSHDSEESKRVGINAVLYTVSILLGLQTFFSPVGSPLCQLTKDDLSMSFITEIWARYVECGPHFPGSHHVLLFSGGAVVQQSQVGMGCSTFHYHLSSYIFF